MRLWTAWVRTCLFRRFKRTEITLVILLTFDNFVFFCVVLGPLEKGQVRNEALRELRVELSKKHITGELDGFTLYL